MIKIKKNKRDFSLFKGPITTEKYPDKSVNLEEVAVLVKTNYREETSLFRETGDKDYKISSFPFVTFSGTFSRRNSECLIDYSNLIVMDLDDVEELDTKREQLCKDPYVRLLFTSPSGRGLKVVFELEGKKENHQDWFRYLNDYLIDKYHLKVDTSGKDLVRACFLCYDPEVYLNQESEIIKLSQLQEYNTEQELRKVETYVYKAIDYSGFDKLSFAEKMILESIDGEKHRELVKAAYTVGGLIAGGQVDEGEAIRRLKVAIGAKSNVQSLTDAYKTIDRCIAKGKERPLHSNSIGLERISQVQNSKMEYGVPEILTEQFYEKLPDVLRRGCSYLEDSQEKNVFLLGALSLISGCLPGVYSFYDGGVIESNLYGYILGRAGTGKGSLKYSYSLVKGIEEEFENRYKDAYSLYESQMESYRSLSKADRDKRKVPKKPPVVKFRLPGNCTASGFLQLLQFSKGRGVMFETEGDTLANTFKTDHGNYSDLFRKGFHHEKCSSYRKTEQEEFEVTPFLSVLLSSTFDQLTKLMRNAENGLFSRFMFYQVESDGKFKNVKDRSKNDNTIKFESLGSSIFELYQILVNSEDSIEIMNTIEQDEKFLDFFQEMKDEIIQDVSRDLEGTVNRLGLICQRIMMILTSLRILESGEINTLYTVADQDFESALTLITLLKQESIKVYKQLSKISTYKDAGKMDKIKLAKELSSRGYSNVEIQQMIGVKSLSTIANYLNK